MIDVCAAGVTGWTGGAVARGVLEADDLRLACGVARSGAGDLGVPVHPTVRRAGSVIGLVRGLDTLLATP